MHQANRWRVGILGAGHISPFHLQALQRIPQATVVGIADLDPARAEQLARRFAIPRIFSSAEDLLAQSLDVLHVLTPPASHARLILQGLEAGCHVLVEKPLATKVEDCDRILQAAEAAGRRVVVDHSLLCDPFTLQARRAVERGVIGRVVAVDCFRSQSYPPYTGGEIPEAYRDGGFPFRDLGIHALYQIEAFLGAIQDLQWQLTHTGPDPLLHFDQWRILAKCAQGTAQIHLSWNTRPLQDLLLIQGTHGVLRLDRFGMTVTCRRSGRLPEHPQRVCNALREAGQVLWQVPRNLARVGTRSIRRYHGLQQLVAEFYEGLQTGRPAPVTLQEARRVTAWVEQVASDADRRKREWLGSFATSPTAPVLVTGGTGLIGRHLVKRLLAQGERLRVLVRRTPPEWLRTHAQVELVYGDLGDPAAVDRAVQGTRLVYHVGGNVTGNAADFQRSTICGTRNVIQAVTRHHVQRLVFVSSLSVLHAAAAQRQDRIGEDWPCEPQPQQRGLYTQYKLQAERMVREACQKDNLPAIILRPAEVLGPGAPVLSAAVGMQLGRQVLVFGRGQLPVPLVNVEDLAEALIRAGQSKAAAGTIIHLVDSQCITQNDLARACQRASNQPITIRHVPCSVLFAAAGILQILFGLLRRPAPVSIYRLRAALAWRNFDSATAERLLQWRPRRGIQQGLQAALSDPPPQASREGGKRPSVAETELPTVPGTCSAHAADTVPL